MSARDLLIAFAERNPATQADVDQVMRALASHDDWFVPVAFAEQAWGQTVFDHVLHYPESDPTRMLNAFTDRDAANLGEGMAVGAYGGPVPGAHLLRSLGPQFEALIVNPSSPREEQWYIASGGFQIAAAWATAVTVERALAERGGGPVPAAELVSHGYHLLVDKPSGQLAEVVLPEVGGAVTVCFTATDRVAEFVASLPPAVRALADFAPMDGAAMFELLRERAADGLVVNAGSADQTALTAEDIADIVAARAARL